MEYPFNFGVDHMQRPKYNHCISTTIYCTWVS